MLESPTVRILSRQESQGQVRKSRTGEKIEDRQESQGQARKYGTGEKVEDRPESQEQAGKSRTGDNRRGHYYKLPKSRTDVEPRTGVHYFRIDRRRADNRRVCPAFAQYT